MTLKKMVFNVAISSIFITQSAVAQTVCNGIPKWDSKTIYNKPNEQVQYQQKLYHQLYWAQGTAPDQSSSWKYDDDCRYLPEQKDHVIVSMKTQVKGPIAFIDPTSNQSYLLAPGQSSIDLPFDTPRTYYISAPGGAIKPNTFVAKQTNDLLSLQYDSYQNQPALVGYLPASWGVPITISQAAQMGYNIIPVAFGEISDTNISLAQDQFVAYTHWGTMNDSTRAQIRADILSAKANDKLRYVLLSLGGQNGGTTLPSSTTEQTTLAKNTIALLNTYGFDGLDFDKENASDDNGQRMDQFIKILKSMKLSNGQTPIVTAAPQLNSVVAGDVTQVGLVSTGTSQAFNQAIVNGDFDYLLIQAYNTGRGSNVINESGVAADETQAQYISNALRYLEKGYPGQVAVGGEFQTIKIPPKTKIIIGEPASPDSANAFSIFHGSSADKPYQAMYKQFNSLVDEPQYGGIMVWDINHDAQNQCEFAKTLAPITSKSFVSCAQASEITPQNT